MNRRCLMKILQVISRTTGPNIHVDLYSFWCIFHIDSKYGHIQQFWQFWEKKNLRKKINEGVNYTGQTAVLRAVINCNQDSFNTFLSESIKASFVLNRFIDLICSLIDNLNRHKETLIASYKWPSRLDVMSLRIWGELPLRRACIIWNCGKTCEFQGYSLWSMQSTEDDITSNLEIGQSVLINQAFSR